MKKSYVLIAGLSLFLTGCTVLSFYPFYTWDVLVKDSRILGNWKTYDDKEKPFIWEISFPDSVVESNEKTGWEEKKVPNTFTYDLICYDNENPGDRAEFKLHLFRLNDQLYLDFYPEDWKVENDLLEFHLMATHTIAQVTLSDTLTINWLDPEWFDDLIKENKIRIHHEKNANYTLLTAKSEELQKFISKYSNDTLAWKDGLVYNLCRNND
jgi:hypothetical protein